MNRVEINCHLRERLGMQKCDRLPGAYWDTGKKRTRMVRDSELHEMRRKRGIEERESRGFVFDVFTRQEDLERVEVASGITQDSTDSRVRKVLALMGVLK